MRRTQSLELSAAYYSIFSPCCGRRFARTSRTDPSLRLFFRGKVSPCLYTILPPRGEISRGNFSPQIALKHPLVFACLFFVQFLKRHRPAGTKRISRLAVRLSLSPTFNVPVKVREIEIGPTFKYIMNAILRLWHVCRIVQHAVFQPDNCIRWP